MNEEVITLRNDPSASTQFLVQASEPLFSALLALQANPPTGDERSVYTNLAAHFQQMQDQWRAAAIDPNTSELANFALAALLDESLLSSDWAYRTKWPLLQYRQFKTHRAGERFFANLNRIRGNTFTPGIWQDQAKAGLLEIYYLCLLLGFNGQWGLAGQTERQARLDQIAEQIRTKPFGPLSPNLSPLNLYDVVPVRKGWPWWVWASLAGFSLVIALIIGIYRMQV